MDAHGGFGDYAERALATDDEMIRVNPIRRFGDGARGKHAFGRGHPHGDYHVLDFAVLIALHSGGAGGNPASESGVQKGVWKMAERHAMRGQLLFEVGAEDARLGARG